MASQQYPSQGAYPPPGAAPPPYVAYDPAPAPGHVPPPQPPPPAAHGAANVKAEKPAQKEKKGFFSSFMKEAEKVGKQIGVELDKAGKSINETVDKNYTSALLDLFKTGNVVQLISRVTGKTVQIVVNPVGQLVIDANGPLDPNAFNTLWTVTNEGNNQVRLHNFNNYITIADGLIVVKTYPPDTPHGLETKFQLIQIQQQFIIFESLKEKTRHLAFLPAGQLKPALAAGKEPDSHFGVKLVSTAYPVITPVVTKHK
ncbi:unnamed protein product [Candidula unifasciata]|uniref:Uncharacterized protein n=1 Tax=Candidula unifasciata TaxID=100452 RepID=A0A8S3Z7N2_9EUPU|nr:unnamed protein product [Candidula unifasciata]